MVKNNRLLYESFTTSRAMHESVYKIKGTIDGNRNDLVLDKIITEFLYYLWDSDYVRLDDFYEIKNSYMASYTILDRNREKYVIFILNDNVVILDTSDVLISAKKRNEQFEVITEEFYDRSRYTRKKEPF